MSERPHRILVVDDEAVIRRLIVINLELEGFEVHEAADGAEALERARAVDPDVITLDIMMPRVDGWTTLRRLREGGYTQNTRIVIISARTRPADVARGLGLGVHDYITKPFDPNEVVATVRRLAEERRRPLIDVDDGDPDANGQDGRDHH